MTRSRWLVVAALATVVLVASLVPGGGRALASPFGVVRGDKWLHAVGYAVLAGAVTYADGRAVVGVLAAVAYGALVELLQLGVPYRSASALDAVANGVGAVVGALAVVTAVRAYGRYAGDAAARSTLDR
ncbi:VanZ family protein [Halorubellus sp. PRR65]|uniref:VanZ family protein n=1 Tax=Halorubellus sp. PRR65 TaxID=3098148 RepID=UPI002B257EAD|nr:VanZ family protein [Halorubellus sp. PRR65]